MKGRLVALLGWYCVVGRLEKAAKKRMPPKRQHNSPHKELTDVVV